MHPPVHRVPVELIANCFLLALCDQIPAMSLDEPPLLFLVVCRRWRDIALSTPRLWSRILVQADKITHDGLNTALSAFAAWLRRSEPVPLSCYIKQPEWQPQRQTKLLAIIFENAPRFLELHFDISLSPSLLTPFTRLRSISLLCDSRDSYGYVGYEELLNHTPNLESLAIECIGLEACRNIDLPQHLTRLRIVEIPHKFNHEHVTRIRSSLPKCLNLQALAIDCMNGSGFPPGDDTDSFCEELKLPRLISLSIRTDDTRHFPAILRGLLCPVLKSISLDAPIDDELGERAIVFFLKYHPTIQTLTYHKTFTFNERRVREGYYCSGLLSDDPRSHYLAQYKLHHRMWRHAHNVESLTLCDHTECSLSWLDCIIALGITFKDDDTLHERISYMLRLRELTVQLRPIASEWYLERFAVVLYHVISSRARLRRMSLTDPVSNPYFPDILPHRLTLRIVFIVEPDEACNLTEDTPDTTSKAPQSTLPNSLECIDHCISVIREKLQNFVIPSTHVSLDQPTYLDLTFDVSQKEMDMYCEDEFDAPYDPRFMARRLTDDRETESSYWFM